MAMMELNLDWSGNLFYEDGDIENGLDVGNEEETSVQDAYIRSLMNKGFLDMGYLRALTGKATMEIVEILGSAVYQNPETWFGVEDEGWEPSEEYLSGNIRLKLLCAEEAAKKLPERFSRNVEALKKLLPKKILSSDIYVTLGSPWIPVKVIKEFAGEVLRLDSDIKHDDVLGTWDVSSGFWNRKNPAYETKRILAPDILKKTLNMQSATITDLVRTDTTKSGFHRVINEQETILAIEKQRKMIDAFESWVWKDPTRKQMLERIYNEKYASFQRRIYDGSFLEFPGMAENVKLLPYQKNAVARILFSPNTLLAHDVGSGKTYIMVAAGMELHRIGASKRNLYVVPNSIVGQWEIMFRELYPDANLLVVDSKNFTPRNRQEILRKIRDNDYDGIIMAYSCFELIPMSKKLKLQDMKAELQEIYQIPWQNRTEHVNRRETALIGRIEKLEAEDEKYHGLFFEDLGITRLFVDEAHNFKNVPIDTKIDHILGINAVGSKKCQVMMQKVHYIQKQNGGGGVVMATGTPITNSITDVFIMQRYLQNGDLLLTDLQNFDSWVAMFAERKTSFEIDVDTSSYRLTTRLTKFHNLTELTSLLANIADFHQVDKSKDLPDFEDYDDVMVEKSPELARYLEMISERADIVRHGKISRKKDNMLKITNDGRWAALDMRLVDLSVPYIKKSKVGKCAEEVYRLYVETMNDRNVQLIFCDISTPKEGFNIYDELRLRLTQMGVKDEEIAYIHDAPTESKRAKLFQKVRNGEVRVLIGSTFKLGLGVNVQNKLVAVHHIDVPWRPADMVQREGRILRQGNENEQIHIFRYITEGSFDAYSWQLLETKQQFIVELLSGSLMDRDSSNIENTALDYGEIKALAIGNPLVKQRVETANELTRYVMLQRKTVEAKGYMKQELKDLELRIQNQERLVKVTEEDVIYYSEHKRTYSDVEKKSMRECLHREAAEYDFMGREKKLFEYQGFDVILPDNMSSKEPHIYLDRPEHRLSLKIGTSEIGQSMRIDNLLNGLEQKATDYRFALEKLKERRAALHKELKKDEDYAERIELCKRRLKELDKELGVELNGQ